jgi:hypothetical protein
MGIAGNHFRGKRVFGTFGLANYLIVTDSVGALNAVTQSKPPFHVFLLSVDSIRRKDGLQKNLHPIKANTPSN